MNSSILTKIATIVLTALLSLTVYGCSTTSVSCSKSDDTKLIHEKTFTASPGDHISISPAGGDIKVTSWGKNEVVVKVYGNERATELLTFTAEQSGSKITVKLEPGKGSHMNGVRVRCEVMVPEKFQVSGNTAGGDISVEQIEGSINLNTAGGDIRVVKINGSVEVNTAGGDISIRQMKGNISANTAGGDVKVSEAEGDVTVSTAGGDVKIAGKNGKIEANTAGGDIAIHYEGDNNGISASTMGGDIDVRVPSSMKADVKLNTMSGSLSVDVPGSVVQSKERNRISAQLNGGGREISCNTMAGDISVKTK